jgi:signal recognition particle receptor subunit beta
MSSESSNHHAPVAAEETRPLLLRTRVRHFFSPYLPPPVVIATKRVDSQLEPLFGPEPTVTIATSLWICWFVLKMFSFLSGSSWSRRKAIVRDDDDDEEHYLTRQYDETVLLCGPTMAGKTSIFYHLVHSTNNRTVKSLKSNIGYVVVDQESAPKMKTLRLWDAPGRWGTQKLLDTADIKTMDRIVLVLDSTQHAAKVADYLYAILTKTADLKVPILVACHKSKSQKAKNPRRIKLQLRTELERLDSLKGGTEGIDWDQVLKEKVSFCSSSSTPVELGIVETFVRGGVLHLS